MGPQSRSAEFSRLFGGRWGCCDPSDAPLSGPPSAGALSAERAPRPAPWLSQASREGSSPLTRGVLQTGKVLASWRAEDLSRTRPKARALGSLREVDWDGLFTVHSDRCRFGTGLLPRWCQGSVANRLAPHPTRLETRTKESNMCASHWVLRNLKAQ